MDLEPLQKTAYPKIELHVHLEGTITPKRLLDIAKRNHYPLPVDTPDRLAKLFHYRDFDHFIRVWTLTTNALHEYDDFRQVVLDYADEAKRHGAVYIEGIFSPIERCWRGVDWDVIFSGYCDGAQEARERLGVEVRLTPDITRSAMLEDAMRTVEYASRYKARGIVGIGLGGEENLYPPEPFEPAFRAAKECGLASVPHAGEVMGPASIRGALEALQADRIRHGIRAEDDPGLVREIAARGIVLDLCPISNLRTGVVQSLAEHPLPRLIAAGIRCSISTDDPQMFSTDLSRDYQVATSLGVSPRLIYEAGSAGAMCDTETSNRLRSIGEAYDWSAGG